MRDGGAFALSERNYGVALVSSQTLGFGQAKLSATIFGAME